MHCSKISISSSFIKVVKIPDFEFKRDKGTQGRGKAALDIRLRGFSAIIIRYQSLAEKTIETKELAVPTPLIRARLE
jgi:hypothetical protein